LRKRRRDHKDLAISTVAIFIDRIFADERDLFWQEQHPMQKPVAASAAQLTFGFRDVKEYDFWTNY
jgi:hypothetical protein